VDRVARDHSQRGRNVGLFYEGALSSAWPQQEDRRRIPRERVDALHVIGAYGTTRDDRPDHGVDTRTEPASRDEILLAEAPGRTWQTGSLEPALEFRGADQQVRPMPSRRLCASEEIKAQASRSELTPPTTISCPWPCLARG
jgi:hypothetical protein